MKRPSKRDRRSCPARPAPKPGSGRAALGSHCSVAPRSSARCSASPAGCERYLRPRIAREQVQRIAMLTREVESLKRDLRDLILLNRPELLARPVVAHSAPRSWSDRPPALSASTATRVSPELPVLRRSRRPPAIRPPSPRSRRQPPAQPRAARHRDHTPGRPETRAYLPARKPRARAESRRCAASKCHLVHHYHRIRCASSSGTNPTGFISGGAPTRLT